MAEYRRRLPHVKDLTRIRMRYRDGSENIHDQHYFIADESRRDFRRWMCSAGVDYCFIDFDGTIYACDGDKRKVLGYIHPGQQPVFRPEKLPVFCVNSCCPCVFDVRKKKVFS